MKHENIIQMLDSFESPQEFCVVTEFAQGELFKIFKDDKCLPEEEVHKIAKQCYSIGLDGINRKLISVSSLTLIPFLYVHCAYAAIVALNYDPFLHAARVLYGECRCYSIGLDGINRKLILVSSLTLIPFPIVRCAYAAIVALNYDPFLHAARMLYGECRYSHVIRRGIVCVTYTSISSDYEEPSDACYLEPDIQEKEQKQSQTRTEWKRQNQIKVKSQTSKENTT
ncbi:serine/threonine-protein kinase TIO [Tanacetum coccineum]